MAKRRRHTPQVNKPAEFDMTPMIDVTFQLIVFFLVANDLSRKEVVELKLPQALFGKEDKAVEKDIRIIINISRPPDPANPPKLPKITVKGKEYDLKSLEKFMKSVADMKREGDGAPGSPSAAFVLIRADRETPWQHVQYVMQVCAQPQVAIYKMQFATTKRDDGKGTIAGDLK